jgi:CRISPR-associated endonuclease Csn1
MHVSSRTGKQLLFKGAMQLVVDSDTAKSIKKIESYERKCKESNNKNGDIKIDERFDKISFDSNLHIYDVLLAKIKDTIYGLKLSSQIKSLENGRAVFIDLSIEKQCVVIMEILYLFQCNVSTANLKGILGVPTAGRIYLNSDISKFEKLYIINQSSTGLFEQRIDLLTV